MPPFDSILAVTLAGFALSATPGPSMLYVLSRSVGQSRAAGLASAFGLAIGGILLAVATALGLAKLFEAYAWMVPALRVVGSIYLVWLGVGIVLDAYRAQKVSVPTGKVEQKSFGSIFWQGVLVEVLNPKTVLFFALFLPPFVHLGGAGPAAANLELQLLFLGMLVPLTAVPSDVVVALMGGTVTKALNREQRYRIAAAWFGGAILVGIAFNIHFGLI